MSNVLPVSNIINVTIAGIPQGLSERNVNVIGLFTTEVPSNSDVYRDYLTASEVVNDYGTSSVTAAMANNVFAQALNPLTGKGKLVIVPMKSAVSATQGTWTTADLTANLAGLKAVSNGDLKVTLNGVVINLTGLDFTSATTISDIVSILKAKSELKNVLIEAVSTTGIKFSSKKVGADSDIELAQLTGGSGTDLSGAGLLNTAAGVVVSGAASSGETLLQAIARVEETVFFAGVMTNLEMDDTVVAATASGIQAMDKIFVHHFASSEDIAGIATTIQQATQTKTRCVGYFDKPSTANLMKAAYVGRAFSVNFSGSLTSQTMNLKALANVTPDPTANQTNYNAALVAGMDLFVSYDGVPSVFSTGGNLFFDQIYTRIQLKFALEASGFNFLRQTNTKVPQTESGMDGLKGAYANVMNRFVRNGYIGTGLTWNSSETFGDPADFRRNITDAGYYIYSLPIAQQAQAERETRTAPLCQISCKEAGAIQKSDVLVIVES